MIIEDIPIRTNCCGKLALRPVMTVIHVGDDLAEFGSGIAENLGRQVMCPYCAASVTVGDSESIGQMFNRRMRRYIFAGTPELRIRPSEGQTP